MAAFRSPENNELFYKKLVLVTARNFLKISKQTDMNHSYYYKYNQPISTDADIQSNIMIDLIIKDIHF